MPGLFVKLAKANFHCLRISYLASEAIFHYSDLLPYQILGYLNKQQRITWAGGHQVEKFEILLNVLNIYGEDCMPNKTFITYKGRLWGHLGSWLV